MNTNKMAKLLSGGKWWLALALAGCGGQSAELPPSSLDAAGMATIVAEGGSQTVMPSAGASGAAAAGSESQGGSVAVVNAGGSAGNVAQVTAAGAGAGGASGGAGVAATGGHGGDAGHSGAAGAAAGAGGADAQGGAVGAAPCECAKTPTDPGSGQCCDGCHFLPAMTFIAESEYSAACFGNKIQVTYRNQYCEGDSGYRFIWGPATTHVGPTLACMFVAGSSDPYYTGLACTENVPGGAMCTGQ